MQTFRLFSGGGDGKGKPKIDSLLLLPTDSENVIESDTWYYEFICFVAADGDIKTYREFYSITDWAEVYKIYVLRKVLTYDKDKGQ